MGAFQISFNVALAHVLFVLARPRADLAERVQPEDIELLAPDCIVSPPFQVCRRHVPIITNSDLATSRHCLFSSQVHSSIRKGVSADSRHPKR